MPLVLPNLDDLRWKDLVAEGRSLIPSSAEEWTDHNPTDPGITLIELLAYVSGMLIYQLNRITDIDIVEFLSLVNGPGWKSEKGLPEKAPLSSRRLHDPLKEAAGVAERRRAIAGLLTPTRAVTPRDFELLTCAVQGVARAICLSRRNLENEDPSVRWMEAAGHVSMVVLPARGTRPAKDLLAEIRQAVEQVRLLTTRVHVLPPRYVKVDVRLTITPARSVHAGESFRKELADKLTAFLHPLRGWFDRKGWPFGRDLHVSELYQLIGKIHGVESISPTRDPRGVFQDEIVVDDSFSNRIVRNQNGRIQAVTLLPDELFDPHVQPHDITIDRHI